LPWDVTVLPSGEPIKGALMASPSWIQVHPTSLPQSGDYQSKLTLMSESLRNDGRIWVPLRKGKTDHPMIFRKNERDYYLKEDILLSETLLQEIFHPVPPRKELMPGSESALKNAYLDFSKAIKNREKIRLKKNMETYSICILKLQDMMRIKNL
jgi:succinate dehydrogenase / fumarate reductase flavoprotein subunit